MDDDDGEVVLALELTEVGEQAGDVSGVVLVATMESNEGVEQEQPGGEGGDDVTQAVAVPLEVEPEAGRGDDVEVEATDVEATMATDSGDASADGALREGVRFSVYGAAGRWSCGDPIPEVYGELESCLAP